MQDVLDTYSCSVAAQVQYYVLLLTKRKYMQPHEYKAVCRYRKGAYFPLVT